MSDIEKVIKSLEICVNDSNVCGMMCEKCQYESDYHKHCHEILMADALKLLKDQAHFRTVMFNRCHTIQGGATCKYCEYRADCEKERTVDK